jgi:Zn-finger protein
MNAKWVNDPNLPFDPINPINHCALFFTATKRIPAKSKLCWYYPMVHQVTSCIVCFCTSKYSAGGSFATARETRSPENSSV